MNIIDIVILLLILLFGVIGFKRGVFKQVVIVVGTILVFVLAFYLKNPLANFLSLHLPFWNFPGSFHGIVVINVILYQLIAFLIVLAILFAILALLINITNVFEKILKYTIVLGIPSKILGFIGGLIEGYVVVFVALFFLNQPALNVGVINESNLKDKILTSTPILSNIIHDTNDTIKEIYDVASNFDDRENDTEFNLKVMDIMLDKRIITVSDVEQLMDKGKLNIIGLENVLNKYR